MSRRRRSEETIVAPIDGRRKLGSLGSAAVCALVVGRSLFPSEDASEGTGSLFILLVLIATGIAAGVAAVRREKVPLDWWAGGWWLVAALVAAGGMTASYRFPAVIWAWEWAALAAIIFLSRWIAAYNSDAATGCQKAAIAIIIGQALLACWQGFVEMPQQREQFRRADPMFIEELKKLGYVPGTPAGMRIQNRIESSEPFGTFGHPNTLAGLLVFGLPIVVASAFANRVGFVGRIGARLVVSIIVLALILTKSRSAWIGGLNGIAVWWLLNRGEATTQSKPNGVRRLIGAAGMIGALGAALAVLAAVGLLDRFVVTESYKSLSYRLEWWRASLGVIAERPLLGVGFGNFGSHYLGYKLPFSSEEISDPHNFPIELWACAGVVTLALYLVLLVSACRQLIRPEPELQPARDTAELAVRQGSSLSWLIGSLLGVGLYVAAIHPRAEASGELPAWFVWIVQLATWPPLLSMILGLVLVRQVGFVEVIGNRRAVVAGLIGVHVNLLAAGGISVPNLMWPCWLVAALGLPVSHSQTAGAKGAQSQAVVAGVQAALALVLVCLFAWSQFFPLLRRDQFLAQARRIDGNAAARTQSEMFERAAEVVPESGSGWERLALHHRSRMVRLGNRDVVAEYRAAIGAAERGCRLDPRRASRQRLLGEIHWFAFERNIDPSDRNRALEGAAAAFQRVVELYPNSATDQWQAARALIEAGRPEEAKTHMVRAMELDATPHLDKKLLMDQRAFARAWLERQP